MARLVLTAVNLEIRLDERACRLTRASFTVHKSRWRSVQYCASRAIPPQLGLRPNNSYFSQHHRSPPLPSFWLHLRRCSVLKNTVKIKFLFQGQNYRPSKFFQTRFSVSEYGFSLVEVIAVFRNPPPPWKTSGWRGSGNWKMIYFEIAFNSFSGNYIIYTVSTIC